MAGPKVDAAYLKGIEDARQRIKSILKSKDCHPLFVRLAFRDAGSFDSAANTFGANGSIRTKKELGHKGNEDLDRAVEMLSAVKEKIPIISFADIYQLAGIVAIEEAGGPTVTFTSGRKDSWAFPPEGYYLSPNTSDQPARHFKQWAERTGLSLQAASALLGAHIIGRWWPGSPYWLQGAVKAAQPPRFGNLYFRKLVSGAVPEDSWVLSDPELRLFAEGYANDETTFLKEYAVAHEQLTRLGTRLVPSTAGSFSTAELHSPAASSTSSYYTYCTELAANPQVQAVGAALVVATSAVVAVTVWRRRKRRLLRA